MSEESTEESEKATEFEPADAINHTDGGEWTQVNQAHYDHDGERELATQLAFAIADAKGVDPLDYGEMPPLYERVDVQSLEETFFGIRGTEARREDAGAVTFTYGEYKVALRADGWIFVYEPA